MTILRIFSQRNNIYIFNKISGAFFVAEESFFYICHSINYILNGLVWFWQVRKIRRFLTKGLKKQRKMSFQDCHGQLLAKSKVDEEVLDNLEEALVSSDVGVDNDSQDH